MAGLFAPPLPKPTPLQTTALVLVIVVEAALIVLVVRRHAATQEQLIPPCSRPYARIFSS
jgi:hypothetical protein